MHHGEQDAHDARARAQSSYTGSWHPLLAAREVEPGTWWMVAQYGERYGIIIALEIEDERGYRAVTGAEDPGQRELVGYFRTLRAAVEATHRGWLARHGTTGFAPNPWPQQLDERRVTG